MQLASPLLDDVLRNAAVTAIDGVLVNLSATQLRLLSNLVKTLDPYW